MRLTENEKDLKVEDLEYIKGFSKITVKEACERNGVKYNNLWTGNVSVKKVHKIRKFLELRLALLNAIKEERSLEEDAKRKKEAGVL